MRKIFTFFIYRVTKKIKMFSIYKWFGISTVSYWVSLVIYFFQTLVNRWSFLPPAPSLMNCIQSITKWFYICKIHTLQFFSIGKLSEIFSKCVPCSATMLSWFYRNILLKKYTLLKYIKQTIEQTIVEEILLVMMSNWKFLKLNDKRYVCAFDAY